jgi:glycosyltransferase involved in cell wall biosynthesis
MYFKSEKGEKIRITFLSIFDLRNPSSIILRNYAIELANLGHEINFIVAPSEEKEPKEIHIKYLFEIKRKPFRGLSLSISSFLLLLNLKKTDIVHFGKPLPVSGLPCLVYRKLKGVPVICQMDDLEVSFSRFRKFPEKEMIGFFEREIPKYVDGITVISKNLKKLASKYCEDVLYLPPLSLVKKFNPNISGEKIRKLHGWKEKKVLMFTGQIGKYSDVDICIKAMKNVVKENKNVLLVIIGRGEERILLEKMVKDLGLKNFVQILDPVPYDLIQEYLAAADVLLLPMKPDWINSYYRSPLKMFDYMAMGKLIVAQEVGETRMLRNKAILTKPTIEDFSMGILRALNTKENLGEKARKFAEKELYLKQVKKLEKFYQKFI